MLDVYLWASIVADKAGRVVSMMASFMVSFVDITDLKEAEETAADLKCVPSVVTGGTPIRAVGINLGAPGDRRADNGTLWLEYPRVGGPSPEIPVNINHEELLFSIDPGYQTDLDDESISEELRREFGNNGISLSQDATVSTEKRDTEWLITKIINKKTYIIRKEEGRLNIYHKDYERYCHHSSRIQRAAGAGSEPVPAWVVASGIKGVSFVTITLAGKPARDNVQTDVQTKEEEQDEGASERGSEEAREQESLSRKSDALDPMHQERSYTIRLYFSEPDDIKPGQRVFDIAIQRRQALRDFDIVKEAGGPNRPVVKEFSGILVEEDLTVALTPSDNATVNAPLICGIEVIAEGW